jgi:pimeloyl-ACP methyl ester carboxylesterase
MRRLPLLCLAVALLCLALRPAAARAADGERSLPRFTVTFTRDVQAAPFTGRVFVFLGKEGDRREPRLGGSWTSEVPFFAVDVKGVRPGEPVTVGGPGTLVYPRGLKELPAGKFTAQAVLDRNVGGESGIGDGAENGYSAAASLPEAGSLALSVDRLVERRNFEETDRVKEVVVESKLLTRFYGRPTAMRAGVVLPEGFASADPARRYPVVYVIPGFGGRHYQAPLYARLYSTMRVPAVVVVLDPDGPLGHHVFADSANNGPRGRALVTELIPAIEKDPRFRILGTARTRLVAGHSSGGWSSLWLQITYPDMFGGVWSTSPDPVDFRQFQTVDLYAPGANLFTYPDGAPRPLGRRGDTPFLFARPFSDRDDVLGRGDQLTAFEGVFSPRLPDGHPRPLWDRFTGAIDPETARAWRRYDIRLVLENDWKKLGPTLAGKLHVYTGAKDTFYLEGAVENLKASLAALGSDAAVEVVPGKDHGTLLDAAMRERLGREMDAALVRAGVPAPAAGP